MAKCPNYRKTVEGSGLFKAGYYVRKCSVCNKELEKEYAELICEQDKHLECNVYKRNGIVGRWLE